MAPLSVYEIKFSMHLQDISNQANPLSMWLIRQATKSISPTMLQKNTESSLWIKSSAFVKIQILEGLPRLHFKSRDSLSLE